jgi:uncharacterized membrane protein YhhN
MVETLDPPLWMTFLVFCGFLFHWTSVYFEWKQVRPFAKALAMALVILWTLFAVHFQVNYFVVFLVIAQIFGLLGDILLLFSGKWFVWGLGAFLVGHFFYLGLLAAIMTTGWHIGLISGFSFSAALICFVLWAAYLLVFTRFFSSYIYKNKSDLPFWIAVILYGATLSFIVASSVFSIASLPGFDWVQIFLPIGAVLFFASDNLLAYDRFVKKIPNGRLWVIVTYHLGQLSLAVGFLYLIGTVTEFTL